MKHYAHLEHNDLLVHARNYNRQAAEQQARGITPVFTRPADWLEEVLDELETRVGSAAVDTFRSHLADEHARMVESYRDAVALENMGKAAAEARAVSHAEAAAEAAAEVNA